MNPTRPELAESHVSGDDDPFRFGWRYARGPDGRCTDERLPLSQDDLLHPQYGDVILESLVHLRDRNYLYDAFAALAEDDPHKLVLSDVQVTWDDSDLKHHGPDVCVIPNVRERQSNYKSFDVAVEGTRPSLIVEVVSPEVRDNDTEKKFDHYYRAGVAEYVIVDRPKQSLVPVVRGYRWTDAGYEPMTAEAGRIWLASIGAWLGVDGERVVCFDEAGERIGSYSEIWNERDEARRARERAERRQQQAERRQQQAERRQQQAERREAQMKLERDRAEAEKAEARRIAAEAAAARAELEAQLRALQARLGESSDG